MDVSARWTDPGFQSEHLKIRVFVAGGSHEFDADTLLIDKNDGSLLLYRIADKNEKTTRLEIVAAFQAQAWQGIANMGTGTIIGFQPQRPT